MDGVIYNTSVFFNNVYSAEWLEDPFAQKIIPPEKLSSGTKTLLLMHFMPENIYNASNCGDNCARWILAIGKAQDVTVNLYHLMNFGERRFTIHVANTDEVVHSMDELVLVAAKCLRESAK